METRPYRSQRRESAAAETRRVVLAAALAAFKEHGYGGATVAGIAASADVAVTTVYASVGGKPQLLVALIEDAAAASRQALTAGRELDAASAEEVLRRLGDIVSDRFREHGWLLSMVYSNTGADPVILEAMQQAEAVYSARVADAARRIDDLGRLRTDVGVGDAADILWFYLGFRRWKVLLDRGWSPTRARAWLGEQVATAILAPA